MENIENLYNNEKFCDVLVSSKESDQNTLKAHWIILCKDSEFFNTMYSCSMKEKNTSSITLDCSAKELEYLIGSLYDIKYDLTCLDIEQLQSLLKNSKRYNCNTLTNTLNVSIFNSLLSKVQQIDQMVNFFTVLEDVSIDTDVLNIILASFKMTTPEEILVVIIGITTCFNLKTKYKKIFSDYYNKIFLSKEFCNCTFIQYTNLEIWKKTSSNIQETMFDIYSEKHEKTKLKKYVTKRK